MKQNHFVSGQYMLLDCALANSNCLLNLLHAATFFDFVADNVVKLEDRKEG